MGRLITIRDTTLRDGHQSLWATRMSTEMMLPVARHIERSGINSVDIMAHVIIDSAVRFTKDNPWDRANALRKLMPTPDMAGYTAGKVAWGFRLAPTDILELCTELTIRNGVNMVTAMNGLLDLDMMVDQLKQAKALGAKTAAALVYSISPVHTDALYEEKARALVERADVDYIMIKDSGGLITPDAAGSLFDAVRRGAGRKKITLHSHAMTGMAGRVYMIGVDHGVDDLQCGVWPLAQGAAQPSTQMVVKNLRAKGYQVDIDDEQIEAISQHLIAVAKRHGFPLGGPVEYDDTHYEHQIPGGMLSNLRSQLADANLLERFPELVGEIKRVRAELGWPTMVTPFAQLVANQALFNVVTGERYGTVPDEITHYVLGHYGQLLAPVDANVLDKILSKSSADARLAPWDMPPALPELRKRYPHASDEERFLRYMIPEAAVEDMLKRQGDAKAQDSARRRDFGPISSALVQLMAKAASMSDVGEVDIRSGDLRLRVVR
ncbi:MAG: carboxylase [Betaproteobacteria bacterium]